MQSFDPRSVAWFAENAPHVPRGQLGSHFAHDPAAEDPAAARAALRQLLLDHPGRPQFVAYDVRCLRAGAPGRERPIDLPLLAWTVRSAGEMRDALACCDNVIFEGFRPDG